MYMKACTLEKHGSIETRQLGHPLGILTTMLRSNAVPYIQAQNLDLYY